MKYIQVMRELPVFQTNRLTIISWPDETIDRIGHDPRGRYVEKYWLGILGPSTTWLLRHIADELEASPSGFVMDLDETARRIGVHKAGKHSPFMKALARLVQFDLAQLEQPEIYAVRRHVPSLSRRHIGRLTPPLQAQHAHWQNNQPAKAS